MRRERVVIHSLDHALAALTAAAARGVAVTLASAPGAAMTVGPSWFKAVIEQASERYPAVAVHGASSIAAISRARRWRGCEPG